MTNLSRNLVESYETLPNEYVVWEGGPSKRGFGAQFIEEIIRFFIIALMIWFLGSIFLGLPLLRSDTESKSKSKSEQTEENPIPDNESDFENNQDRNNSLKIYFGFIGVLVFLTFSAAVICSKLRLRHYWYMISSERITIQSGLFERTTTTMDLDKIISIKSRQSFVERILKLNSIELVHAGVNIYRGNILNLSDLNVLKFVGMEENVTSLLINNWLPRDNRKTSE